MGSVSLSKGLSEVSRHYHREHQGLMKAVLASGSTAEAHLAIIALRDDIPEKTLVTMLNLREVLRELPRCPTAIPVEVEALARVAGYHRVKNSFVRRIPDDAGEYEVIFLGQGNLLYDIIMGTEDGKVFLSPSPGLEDSVSEAALDLMMRHASLLPELIGLSKEMGRTFSPVFYLSLEDWLLEHAQDSLRDISGFF